MPHRRPTARLSIVAIILLSLVSLLAASAPALAFPDVPTGHPYEREIDALAAMGIIGGYTNGDFGLNDTVKRAQFAKMIVGALGVEVGTSTTTRFTDLGAPDANGYPHKFVQAAYDNGITNGTNAAQTLFSPSKPIRRDQVISMIVRGARSLDPSSLLDPPPGTPSLFAGVGEPHGENLRIAEFNGLLKGLIGMGSGWNVTANATRGEVAQMLWNLIPGDYWVYADGSGDYATIEAAAADVGPRDTIHLGPGVFTLSKTLMVDSPLHLVGNGMAAATGTTVRCAGSVLSADATILTAAGVRFVSTATSQASRAVGAGDTAIGFWDCSFSGGNRVESLGGVGLHLSGATYGVVSGCLSSLNDLDGIELVDDASASISNCTLVQNGQCGLTLLDGAAATISEVTCSSNVDNGIAIAEDAEGTIESSDCSDNGVIGIRVLDRASAVIQGNTCDSNGYHGVQVSDSAEATVEGNTCSGNGQAGIAFFQNSSGSVQNNECTQNKWGLYVAATSTVTVGSNNLHGNTHNFVKE